MEKRLSKLENEKQMLVVELQHERNIKNDKNTVMDQEELKNNVIIHGISNECLDIKASVVTLANVVDSELKITGGDFVKLERLFVQKDGLPKERQNTKIPIVASFKDYETKEKFMKAQKNKKIVLSDDCQFPGESGNIFARDQLTRYNYNLLRSARSFRSKNLIKYSWVQNSKILVRRDDGEKIHWIKSMMDLVQFDESYTPQVDLN